MQYNCRYSSLKSKILSFYLGAGKDVIKSDVKDLHTLADIMKAERTSYKETSIQSSTPIPIQKVKTSQATTTAKKG